MLRRERGAVLLAFVLILVIAAAYVLTSKLNSASATAYRQSRNAKALAESREALVGRAVADINRPGSLPCPDTNGDGQAELFAGTACPDYIGRFPWRTLEVADVRDFAGEQLWYALSRNFRDHPAAGPINSETAGQLTLDGTGDVVAVVFAADSLLPGQNRPNNIVTNYLEAENSDGDDDFVSMAVGDFNDQAAAISRQELMGAIEKRVGAEVRRALLDYESAFGNYPFAAPFSAAAPTLQSQVGLSEGLVPANNVAPPIALPAWFQGNGWDRLTVYAVNCADTPPPGCPAPQLRAGTVNADAIVATAGRRLNGVATACGNPYNQQVRDTGSSICDYLDRVESTNSDEVFDPVGTAVTATYNDRIKIVSP
ncbi:MAG: hypothetical protein R3F45_07820 [Gammaproteobacteria bacterium]